MKRILVILAVLLCAATPSHANYYGWTLSTSSVNPFFNSGSISAEPFPLFLWYQCSWGDGMRAAEFDLSVPPGMAIIDFTTTSVFLNAGGAGNLLLSVNGCPYGPIVAGSWTLVGSTPGSICLVNSAANGLRVVVDCDMPTPHAWPILAVGFGYGVPDATCVDSLIYCSIATEPTSWGFVKGLYR